MNARSKYDSFDDLSVIGRGRQENLLSVQSREATRRVNICANRRAKALHSLVAVFAHVKRLMASSVFGLSAGDTLRGKTRASAGKLRQSRKVQG